MDNITHHAHFQLIEELLVQLLAELFRYLLRAGQPVVVVVFPRQVQIRVVRVERPLDL